MDLPEVPCYDQGLWAMHPPAFRTLHAQKTSPILCESEASTTARSARLGGRATVGALTQNGVVIIPIVGVMVKYAPEFGVFTSTVGARLAVRQARFSDNVGAVVLAIESPGGIVAGTKELADEIDALAKEKPTVSFISDVGASAAYWVACQAGRVYANATALVGSIGTYGVFLDESAAAERAGVKVHVINAGEFKGMGTPGTIITDAHLVELRRRIEGYNQFFLQAVADGRSMSIAQVQSIADGRAHLAADAQRLGLIDGIATMDEVYAGAVQAAAPRMEQMAAAEQAQLQQSEKERQARIEAGNHAYRASLDRTFGGRRF